MPAAPPQAELAEVLQQLRATAVEANKVMATDVGIKPAAAVTCIKPSGTVSQLVDSASGIHPRHSEVGRPAAVLMEPQALLAVTALLTARHGHHRHGPGM